MKIYLRSVSVFLVAIFTLKSATAQDVGVTAITGPAPGSTLQAGVDSILRFDVKNFGPASLLAGDTLWMQYQMEGASPNGLIYIFASEFTNGSTLSLYTVNPVTFPTQPGSRQVCVYTVQPGDVNDNNDELCVNYNMVSGPIGITYPNSGFTHVYRHLNKIMVRYMNINGEDKLHFRLFNLMGQVVASHSVSSLHSNEINFQFDLENHPVSHLILGVFDSRGKLIGTVKL